MRVLPILLLLVIVPSLTFAASENGGHRIYVEGFYGLGSVSPTDINNLSTQQSTSPALTKVSTDTFYGGGLGVRFAHRFGLELLYDSIDAKSSTNTNLGSGSGYELMQNDIWAGITYLLVVRGVMHVYLGAAAGYPTYSHVTQTLALVTQYDADKKVGYLGQLGVGVMFGSHVSLFFEGDYVSLVSGNIKDSGGNVLVVSGNNAKMDLSGARGLAGLAIYL